MKKLIPWGYGSFEKYVRHARNREKRGNAQNFCEIMDKYWTERDERSYHLAGLLKLGYKWRLL